MVFQMPCSSAMLYRCSFCRSSQTALTSPSNWILQQRLEGPQWTP